MRMSEGVEWALHCLLNLSFLDGEDAVPAAKLAAFHDLPAPYLTKQLQALARAEIVSSVPGPRGGFRLARPPERISLMDVVAAIEGPEEAFRCKDIREHGPGGGAAGSFKTACAIDVAMRKAELAWRRSLADQTLADIVAAVERGYPNARAGTHRWFATTS